METGFRRRPWRLPLFALGLLVLVVGGFRLRLELKCSAMKAQVHHLQQEIASLDSRRPPLHPPGIPGNAWTDYEAALDYVLASQGPNTKWIRKHIDLANGIDDGVALTDSLLGSTSPVVGHLRKGADRAEFRYPDAWMRGDTGLFDRYWEALDVLGICIRLEAQRLADAGDAKGAIEFLAAAAQFAFDLGRGGPLTSGVGRVVITAMGEHVQERRTGAGELETLDRLLAELDGGFQDRAILRLRSGVLVDGVDYLKGNDPQLFDREGPDLTWRDGYSPQVRRAASFLRSVDRIPRVEQAIRAPTAVGEYEARTALRKEIEVQGNLMDRWGTIGAETHGHNGSAGERSLHARIRMLRIGVRFLRDGSVLDLPDPYEGGRLLHERSGDRLRTWSAATVPGMTLERRKWKDNDARTTILEVVR